MSATRFFMETPSGYLTSDMTTTTVAPVDEFEDKKPKCVEVDGLAIAVIRVGDEFYAVQNRCPHKGAALCRGRHHNTLPTGERRNTLHCPWHFWEWDLETGESPVHDTRVRTFDVIVEDGTVKVDI